jgi:DNA-directed RNA polymerase subunit RPC12/RpoP
MSLYRCAACGSPNVVTDTEKEGYSYAKGAVGTVLLGVGGAAAGINGKTKTVYKCPDCGTTLSYSMPFEIKTLIDMGVMSEKMRDNLQLNGAKIDWITLTSRYKNIENSSFVATNTQPVQEINVAPQVADKKTENAVPEETKNENRSK